MRIEKVQLEAFGALHNLMVERLSPHLTVFLGANESGKTTLKEFIIWVLFGFERGHKGNKYEPVVGGRPRGRVVVRMADGRRLTFERVGTKEAVFTEKGERLDVSPSSIMAPGFDRHSFERVFAVGLDEMQGVDVLTEEGVRTRLFAAGGGLGRLSLAKLMSDLQTAMDRMYKRSRRATQPKLNSCLSKLHEIRKRLAQSRSLLQDYEQVCAEVEDIRARQERLREERVALQRRISRLELLGRMRRGLARLRQLDEEIAKLRHAEQLPAKAETRFEKLKDRIQTLQRELDNEVADLTAKQQELNKLAVREELLQQAQRIERLRRERAALERSLNDISELKEEAKRLRTELDQALRQIGPDTTEALLEKIDISVVVVDEAQRLMDELKDAEERLRQAQNAKEQAEKRLSEARSNYASIEQELKQMLARAPDEQEFRRRSDALQNLRTLLAQRGNIEQSLKTLGMTEAALQRTQPTASALPSWLFVLILVVGLALAALLAGVKQYAGAMVAAAATISMLLLLRKTSPQKDALSQVLANMESQKENLRCRLNDIQRQLHACVEALQLKTADEAELAKAENALQQMREELEQLRRLKERLAAAADELKKAEKEFNEADKALRTAKARQQQALDRWRSFLLAHHFPENLREQGFSTFVQIVENAHIKKRNLIQHEKRVQKVQNHIDATTGELKALLSALGRDTAVTDPLATIDNLVRDLEEAKTQQAQREKLQEEIARIKEKVERLQKDLREAGEELTSLMKAAGAENEDSFYAVCRDHDTLQSLKEKRANLMQDLLEDVGGEEAFRRLAEEVEQLDISQQQQEETEIRERLEQIEQEEEEAARRLGELQQMMKELEKDATGRLHQEIAQIEEELREGVKDWAVYAVCRQLLRQAKEIYEKERQPEVIKYGNDFLSHITDGRYRLLWSVEGEEVRLESLSDGTYKEEVKWSSGLADQVYLSVRLGLAREWANLAEPLPLVLDDVLVRFDPQRQRACARMLTEVAKSLQILLFTCHPSTMEHLLQAARDVGVNALFYELSDSSCVTIK